MTDDKYIELRIHRESLKLLNELTPRDRFVYFTMLFSLDAEGKLYPDGNLTRKVLSCTGYDTEIVLRSLTKLLSGSLFKPVEDGKYLPTVPIMALSDRFKLEPGHDIPLDLIKAKFEECRRKYPGHKRGFEPEFAEFVKNTANKQERYDITERMSTAIDLEIQVAQRREAESGKGYYWKHFTTYLNKRGWEYDESFREELKPKLKKRPMLPT